MEATVSLIDAESAINSMHHDTRISVTKFNPAALAETIQITNLTPHVDPWTVFFPVYTFCAVAHVAARGQNEITEEICFSDWKIIPNIAIAHFDLYAARHVSSGQVSYIDNIDMTEDRMSYALSTRPIWIYTGKIYTDVGTLQNSSIA